jgi:hypothetical protein
VVGQRLRGLAQQPPDPLERIVLVAALVQGLLLHTAADLVDSGQAEAGDVEGVEHSHRAGQQTGSNRPP